MTKIGISKNLTLTATSQVISFFFLLGFSVLVARALGPEGQGLYSLWILIPTLLARFAHLGFDASFAYYAKDERFKSGIITSIWFFLVLVSLLLGFFFYLYYLNSYDDVDPNIPVFVVIIIAALVTLFISRTLLMALLVGENRIRLHSVLSILEAVSALSIVLVLMPFLNLSAEIVLLAMFITMILVNFILILKCVRTIARPNYQLTYIAFRYGVKSWLNNVLNQLIYRSDLLLIGYFLGVVEVGLYSIALLLVEKSWFFTTAISNALFPILRASATGSELTARLVRVSVFFTLIFAIFLVLTGKLLIPFIFGDDYTESWTPLLWLLPGVIALTIPKVLVTQFAAMDKMQFAVFSSGPALVVNILLNVFLIPEFGLKGAAIATSISYVMYFVVNVYFYKRLTNVQIKQLLFLQKQDWFDFKTAMQKFSLNKFKFSR